MEFSTDGQYLIVKIPLAEVDSLKAVLALASQKGMPKFEGSSSPLDDFEYTWPKGVTVKYKHAREVILSIEGSKHYCKIGRDTTGFRVKWIVVMDGYAEVSASASDDGKNIVSIIRKAGERSYAATLDEVPPLYRGGDFSLVQYKDHVTDSFTPAGMAIILPDPQINPFEPCVMLALHAWLRRKYR